MYHAFSGLIQRVTPLSFVVVTLYIPAMIMDSSYDIETAQISTNRYHLQLMADAWCKCVFFASILKRT
jgi:hypothetical protein